MAVNPQRNSTNHNSVPTVTIVDSVDKNDRMSTCCFCVPLTVGVFAILLMSFFLGIFSAAASFVSLGYSGSVSDKIVLSVAGSLYTFIAIISALGVSAIRKEKIILMRRLSIVFLVLTALLFIFNIIVFILDSQSVPEVIKECVDAFEQSNVNGQIDQKEFENSCTHFVHVSLASEGIRVSVTGIVSLYFAFVVFMFARRMRKQVIPFTIAPAASTPTYQVYNVQPPTSNNWVPPPTYTVNPSYPLPDDFKPDSKEPIN